MPIQYEKEPLRIPFWESIIELTNSFKVVSAGNEDYIEIRPPVGETWFIFLFASVRKKDVNNNYVALDTNTRIWVWSSDGVSAYDIQGSSDAKRALNVQFAGVLTNDKYIRVYAKNEGTDYDIYLYLHYSGFKL